MTAHAAQQAEGGHSRLSDSGELAHDRRQILLSILICLERIKIRSRIGSRREN
jgi:hypothetical protein